MFKTSFIISALLLAVTAYCEARCRFTDQILPVNVDMLELSKKTFKIVFESASNITYYVGRSHKKSGDDTSNKNNGSDGTTKSSNYTAEYGNGEMSLSLIDESGKSIKINTYVLAKTDEDAYLLYTCSDSGVIPDDVDLRIIIVTKGTTLSDEGTRQLLAADNKFNFHPDLIKISNNS